MGERDTILVVDDIEVNRILLKRLFEDKYTILVAEDGIEAMDIIKKYHEELIAVLLDIVMPRASGYDVLKCIKEEKLMGVIPVVLITGDNSTAAAKQGYDICKSHHERYDGGGYPDGLVGENIPIAAQVVAIADVYDALVSERVYKAAYTKDEAYKMILNGECGAFNPKIIECFMLAKEDFERLADSHKGDNNTETTSSNNSEAANSEEAIAASI